MLESKWMTKTVYTMSRHFIEYPMNYGLSQSVYKLVVNILFLFIQYVVQLFYIMSHRHFIKYQK